MNDEDCHIFDDSYFSAVHPDSMFAEPSDLTQFLLRNDSDGTCRDVADGGVIYGSTAYEFAEMPQFDFGAVV